MYERHFSTVDRDWYPFGESVGMAVHTWLLGLIMLVYHGHRVWNLLHGESLAPTGWS
jgi:hypothetical protein